MNLFRSEAHARNWSGFDPNAAAGLQPLSTLMAMFSSEIKRRRGRPDYISTFRDFNPQYIAEVKQLTDDHPFWRREG